MASSSSTFTSAVVTLPSTRSLRNPILFNCSRLNLIRFSPPFHSIAKHRFRVSNGTSRLNILCMHDSRAPVVTKESWEKSIVNSDIPVLVEFYASWCGPCRMVHRVIDEIAEEYAGRLQCFMLNTDNDLQVAENYEIKAVPVVLLFKNGEKREAVVGTMPKEFYIAAIERVLKS